MKDLSSRMKKLGITEDDLEEKFIYGSGADGQKVNKTHSCVQLQHRPSRIVIKKQSSRSREKNRMAARAELCTRLEAAKSEAQQKLTDIREKHRRSTRQRSRRQKARMLDAKSRHSMKKSRRRRPSAD